MTSVEKLIIAAIAVTGIAVLGAGGCTCVGNISGASHDEATAAARSWGKEMGLDVQGVSCANSDTNGDGYVSCSVSAKNKDGSVQIHPVECAAAYTFNSGCRAARIIPNQGQ